jgi:MFS family permease
MHAPSISRTQHHELLHEAKAGFTYIVSQPVILGIMIMEGISSVFGLDHAMLTIFASDILRVGASGFGLLQSARGAGAVIGSSLFIAVGQRSEQGKILFTSAILYGIGFALFGLSPSFLLSLVIIGFVGATDTVWSASRSTILQVSTPENFRGRVMGVFQLSNRGLHPLGQMETGLVVPLMGAPAATFFGGLLVSAVTLIIAWRIPQIPKFRWKETDDHPSVGSVAEDERATG